MRPTPNDLSWRSDLMSYIDCCDGDECNRCGTCLIKCPVMKMKKDEARSEIALLLEGKPAPRVFSECTLCYACNAHCPSGLKPYELMLERIAERNSKRKSISAMVPYFLLGMPGNNFWSDVYGSFSAGEKRILEKWSEPPAGSREVLYMGCGARLFCGDIENSLGCSRTFPNSGRRTPAAARCTIAALPGAPTLTSQSAHSTGS